MNYEPKVELEEVNGDSMAKDMTLWILKLQFLQKEDMKKLVELMEKYLIKVEEITSIGMMDESVKKIIELMNQYLIKVDEITSRGMIDESTRKQIVSFKELCKRD